MRSSNSTSQEPSGKRTQTSSKASVESPTSAQDSEVPESSSISPAPSTSSHVKPLLPYQPVQTNAKLNSSVPPLLLSLSVHFQHGLRRLRNQDPKEGEKPACPEQELQVRQGPEGFPREERGIAEERGGGGEGEGRGQGGEEGDGGGHRQREERGGERWSFGGHGRTRRWSEAEESGAAGVGAHGFRPGFGPALPACVLLVLCQSKVVREHERAVVFRMGHQLRRKPRGPGLLFFLPVLDVCHIVDIRLKTLKIPLHTVVTKDLLQWELSAVCYYQLENVALCSGALCSLDSTLQAVVQAAIRDVLSELSLSQALGQRRRLGQRIQRAADALVCRWGIRLERADIEELVLPAELQRKIQPETETRPHPQQVRATDSDRDPWDGLRSSLRLLQPALVLPLPPDLLNVTSDLSPLPPPPPPVAVETERQESTPPGTEDSPMM